MGLRTRVIRNIRNAAHGFAYAKRLFARPVTPAESIAAIRGRLADRVGGFLTMVERTIFAQPESPYRALLTAAGYDFSRLRTLVLRDGIEETLRALCRDGVYVSIEEFKGIHDARRGDRTYRLTEQDFRNPLIGSGLLASSGGTGGQRIPTIIGAASHRVEAERLAVALTAYGLEDHPVAVWLPAAHGASFWAVLALAAMRKTPARWFTQLSGPNPSFLSLRASSRLYGVKLPAITPALFGEEHKIIQWMTHEIPAGGCGIFTTPSSALRLAVAAERSGVHLPGLTFLTIGEPLTHAKVTAIQRVGGRAFSSLGFTEFGRATYGCASPASPDDSHICSDCVAVIHRRRSVDRVGTEVDALLFTALQPDSRRVLLNVETGDYAMMKERRCGCLLEQVGWTWHLEGIRSFEKLNPEGLFFFGSQLVSLIEEVLPARFGGDLTDYQLVEREDEDGFTRLDILVHPRLGEIDENAVLGCVRDAIRMQNRFVDMIWDQTHVLRVHRSAPMLTGAGKLMPLHHLGSP